ncbi:MAG: DEAD/DEAH box helicase [Chlamydiota bacterium]
MNSISFHLTLLEGAFFLVLKAKKPLFWHDLVKELGKPFATFLLQEQRKESGESLDTLIFSKVPIRPSSLWTAIQGAKKALYYKGERLLVLEQGITPIFTVLEEEKRRCFVDYSIQHEGKEYAPKTLFLSCPPCVLWNSTIGKLDTTLPARHWRALEKGPAWIRHFYDEELPFRKNATKLQPTLQMADHYGKVFTLLGYHPLKQALQIPSLEERRPYQKDLESLGWRFHPQGLFPPREELFTSLELLASLDWKILDKMSRPVLFCNDASWKIVGKHLTIAANGIENPANIRGFLQAAKTGSPFVMIEGPFGEKKTFLIDPPFEKKLARFKKVAISENGGALDHTTLGLFDPSDDFSGADPSFKQLLFPPKVELKGTFLGKLYPYQEEGLAWMHGLYLQGWGGLLADEMGLGKTVQVLAFFACLTGKNKLIIAPAHLVFHWEKEATRFLGETPYVHLGKRRKPSLDEERFIITSYATLTRDLPLFEKMFFDVIVMDESSQVKNPKSSTYESLMNLKKRSCFALNGTPIDNAYEELWAQFSCVHPKILGERKTFIQEAHLEKNLVIPKLRPFLCKRTKEEVNLELPPITVQEVLLSLGAEHQAFYQKKQEELRQSSPSALEMILRLRQSAIAPALLGDLAPSEKFSALFADLEQLRNKKVLIFSAFTKALRFVEKALIERNFSPLYIDGTVSLREREKRIATFRSAPSGKVFLLSIKAASVGINLPEAHLVLMLDPWWNESAEQQAIARAHRIGRKEPLLVKRYIAKDTIEEKILQLKQDKLLYSALVDASITQEDCLRLFC